MFRLWGILGVPFSDDRGKGLELLLLDEVKLLDKEDEVTTACVDVRSKVLLFNVVSVGEVEVSVHAEEAAENILHGGAEDLWEGNIRLLGKQGSIFQFFLNPAHEIVDVFGSAAGDGLLDLHPIGPLVLVLGSCIHDRTRLWSTKLSKVLVQNLNLVEEVQHCKQTNEKSVRRGRNFVKVEELVSRSMSGIRQTEKVKFHFDSQYRILQ